MRRARMMCDADFIRESLKLPDSCQIIGAYWESNTINLILTDPDLKEVGDEIPLITPILNVIRWDWNQEE